MFINNSTAQTRKLEAVPETYDKFGSLLPN